MTKKLVVVPKKNITLNGLVPTAPLLYLYTGNLIAEQDAILYAKQEDAGLLGATHLHMMMSKDETADLFRTCQYLREMVQILPKLRYISFES